MSITRQSVDRVRVVISQAVDSTSVFYTGQAEDLLALGVVTADMLKPGTPGRKRQTPTGYYYWRQHCRRTGQYKVALMWLPYEVAEAMPGVPRTWRSVVGPMFKLSDDQRQAFEAEGGLYQEAGAY